MEFSSHSRALFEISGASWSLKGLIISHNSYFIVIVPKKKKPFITNKTTRKLFHHLKFRIIAIYHIEQHAEMKSLMTIPISQEKHCDDEIMCQPYFFHWKIEQ